MASQWNLAWVITSGAQDSQEICRILKIAPHRCYDKGTFRTGDAKVEPLVHPFTTLIFGLRDERSGERIEHQVDEAIREIQTLKDRLKKLLTPYSLNLHCRPHDGSGVVLTGEQIALLSAVGAGVCIDPSPSADFGRNQMASNL